MTRFLITLLTVACAVALPDAQRGAFRAATDTVSIYATVVDRSGRLIPDLTKDDFQVFDNGRPQALTVFKNEIQPITIVVMLDRSGSMVGNYEIVNRAAESFVGALLPEDRARLGSFSNQIQIDPQQFTSSKDELRGVLRTKLVNSGATPLWNATSAAMNGLAGEDGRRVVLLFTDGYDSPANPYGNVTFEQVVARSQTEEIMVYAIGLGRMCEGDVRSSGAPPQIHAQRGPGGRGPGGGRVPRPMPPIPFPGGIGGRIPVPRTPPLGPNFPGVPRGGVDDGGLDSAGMPFCLGVRPDPGLKVLAEEGGGGYFELRRKDDLVSTFSRVADELHHQYLLAFKAEQLDGTLHKLEVRLRNPTWIARARKSYLAAGGNTASGDK